MHQVLGLCINNENFDYTEIKNKIASFLNYNAKDVIDKWTKDMEEASNNLEFERSIGIRNLIESINNTILKQKISINDLTNRDYIGIYIDNDSMILFQLIITRLDNIIQNHQIILDIIDDSENEALNYL